MYVLGVNMTKDNSLTLFIIFIMAVPFALMGYCIYEDYTSEPTVSTIEINDEFDIPMTYLTEGFVSRSYFVFDDYWYKSVDIHNTDTDALPMTNDYQHFYTFAIKDECDFVLKINLNLNGERSADNYVYLGVVLYYYDTDGNYKTIVSNSGNYWLYSTEGYVGLCTDKVIIVNDFEHIVNNSDWITGTNKTVRIFGCLSEGNECDIKLIMK